MLHLIECPLTHALLSLCILADKGHLCVFALHVGLQAHEIKVAGNQQYRVASAFMVNGLPQCLNEQLVTRLVSMLE